MRLSNLLVRPADSVRVRSGLVSLVMLPLGLSILAAVAVAQEQAVPLETRARGAERVVVGRVASVNAAWQVNDFGDRLIVSAVHVTVDETLKGQTQQTVDVEVEGGTIGDLTLRVSDLTTFRPGERAVFYLTRSRRGTLVPYMRGQGLLKLDGANRVAGSNTTLDQIRAAARPGAPANPPR
jgi:hypothetical protein